MRIDQFISGEAVDSLGDVLLLVGLDGSILDANPAALDCYGYSRAEMLSLSIGDIRAPQDQDAIEAQMREPAEHAVLFEAEHRRSDGTRFPVEVRTVPVSIHGETASLTVVRDISDSKQEQESLHDKEWRLASIIEATRVGTWEWNVQTGEVIYSEMWAQIVGHTLDELAPTSIKTFEMLAHPDDLRQSDELLERHFAGELPYYDFEGRMKHKDGHWVWVHDRGRVITRTGDGKPLLMFGTHTDITGRKRAEEALRESERHFRTLFDLLPEGVAALDADGVITFANPALERMLAISQEKLRQGVSRSREYVRTDGTPMLREEFASSICTREGRTVHGPVTGIVKEDGSVIWVSVTASPTTLTDWRTIIVATDITERKQAEQEQSRVEGFLRATFEHANVGIAHVGLDGAWLRVNQRLCDLLGYTREELLHMGFADITHPDDLDENLKHLRMVVAGDEETYEAEKRSLRKDGAFVWVSLSVALIRDEGGAPDYLIVVVTDISERKRMESDLREAGRTAERYLNVAAEVIVNLDAQGNITLLNESGHRLLGYAPGELIGKNWIDTCVPEEARTEVHGIFARLMDGEGADVLTYENPVITKSGNRLDLLWHNTLLRDTDDCIVGLLSSAEDISERKQAEDEILRLNTGLEKRVQERTAELLSVNRELSETNLSLEEATRAKSDFLAAMSHELRTPLNSIIGFSDILGKGMAGELNAEQRKQIEMINNSGRHLLELINGVLDLVKIESGQNEPTIRKVDVGAIARGMFDTVRPMADEKGIEMRWACPDDLAPVRTDRLRVGQILLNLIGNAVKFTERGYVSATVSQDSSGVTIAVEDSGCGIAEKDLGRVFDDFYQITPHGGVKNEGTGLGLAVSLRWAESIGARIEVASEPGHGSTFTLRIPERPR